MRFDTASATPKLVFRGIRPLEESEYVISKEQGLSDDATRAITMTVSQTDGVKDKGESFAPTTPAPVAIEPPKPKAKPAPVPEIYDEPAIDEPVKVSKEDAPAPKADLLNLIDEWDQ
jgi:hypothetical protein